MSSVEQNIKIYKLRKILVSNVIISKETILTKGYELPLNAFQLFGISRLSRMSCS